MLMAVMRIRQVGVIMRERLVRMLVAVLSSERCVVRMIVMPVRMAVAMLVCGLLVEMRVRVVFRDRQRCADQHNEESCKEER